MNLMSAYSVRLTNVNDIRKALHATADIYRKAVDFLLMYVSANGRMYQYAMGKIKKSIL
mgnify:CR=1 FL=1